MTNSFNCILKLHFIIFYCGTRQVMTSQKHNYGWNQNVRFGSVTVFSSFLFLTFDSIEIGGTDGCFSVITGGFRQAIPSIFTTCSLYLSKLYSFSPSFSSCSTLSPYSFGGSTFSADVDFQLRISVAETFDLFAFQR